MLDAKGLIPSPEIPAGGVKTLLMTEDVGCALLDGAYAGYLCILDRWSGGGSWKVGRLEAADRRAVKLWGVSIARD